MGFYAQKYKDCLEYIDSYWDKIIRKPKKLKIQRHILDIPHSYLVPNEDKFNLIFYWDSYFMSRGLFGTKREKIIRDMVENFLHLYGKYHFIPNFNTQASMGRSQPPFLTSMIRDAYEIISHERSLKTIMKKGLSKILQNKKHQDLWLKRALKIAIGEYSNVWLDINKIYHHSVEGFELARYGDSDLGYAHSSELESGWDFTSRFYNRCNEFLPVDLNTFLYKYEMDFGKISNLLGEKDFANDWINKAGIRKKNINSLMWDPHKGFFFDYNYARKRISAFYSLAGFVPLWAGVADYDQAKKMLKVLPRFETEFGLTITDKYSLAPMPDLNIIPLRYRIAVVNVLKPKQWDWPNIWPPLEYLAVIGILRYGFRYEARRIMEKSLAIHAKLFRKHKTFFEKIDAVKGTKASDYSYPTQTGFGWTNAIFFRYVKILDELEEGRNIYDPDPKSPPYTFAIYH